MSGSEDPRNRQLHAPTGRTADPVQGNAPADWETRVLAQVRPRVRELAADGAAQAGWETDTITRLEDYFDRGEV